MKTVLTLIAGMVIGYAISGVVPMSQLKATLLNIFLFNETGGNEIYTEAGAKTEAPKQ